MFFDFIAQRHKSSSVGSWNLRRFIEKKFRILQECGMKGGTCLEVGPGEGVFAKLCRNAGMAYSAIERSPKFQQELQAEGFDVVLGTAPPLPYPDQHFDVVCLLAVLEHMATFEQAIELLSEANRVLKPNGLVAVEVPDYLRCGIDFYAWDYTHSYIVTPLRLEQILQDIGFLPLRMHNFSGSFTFPILRWPIDLVGFLVHSRFIYWLVSSLGGHSLLEKYHKTFEPVLFAVSRKPG